MNKKRQRQEIGGEDGFEGWGGYMAAKKAKLRGQFENQAGKEAGEGSDEIFKGVSIFVNGYTEPSADDLRRIMMVHGGVYHHYMSIQHTTHIIATNLPDVKIKQLKSLHLRVVKPDWITACLDAGRQVDYTPYLLYSHQSITQPSITSYGEVSKKVLEDQTGVPGPSGLNSHKRDAQTVAPGPSGLNRDRKDAQTAIPGSSGLNSHNKGAQTTVPGQSGLNSDTRDAQAAVPGPSGLNSYKKDFSTPHTENETLKSPLKQLGDFPKTAVNDSSGNGNCKGNSNSSRCATEPNFLSEFYNNSRLHHISTMGATFKQYVNELRQSSNGDFPGMSRLRDWVKKKQRGISGPPTLQINRDDDDNDFDDFDEPTAQVLKGRSSSNFDQVIMHIDMDCFFVSVGLRNHPELRGQPVAVTHSKGGSTSNSAQRGADRKYELNYYKQRLESKLKNKAGTDSELADNINVRTEWIDTIDETNSMSEIASCSYEARKAGIKNGMFMGTALKLCPALKTIPYDFEGYKEVAYTLYNTVASYTLDIEAVSCDEMFVDCSSLLKEAMCTPLEFASCIREEIKGKTQCPASTGFGENRLLARLATRKAKPDGQFYLEPSAVCDFMKTVKIDDLPGVGRSMAYRLQAMDVHTCQDLQELSLAKLQEFGNKTGEALYEHCRGRDNRPLNFGHQRKSVSAEVNYGIRFKTFQEVEMFIRQLSLEVQTRLEEVKMKGKCVTLKLMVRAEDAPTETAKFMGHGVCDNISKSTTLMKAISDADSIAREVLLIMKKHPSEPSDLRGVGIQISRLESCGAGSGNSAGALDKFLVKKSSIVTAPETPEKLQTIPSNSLISSNGPNESAELQKTPGKVVPANTPFSPKGKKKVVKPSPAKKNVPKGVQGIDKFMVSRKKSSRKDDVSKLPNPSQLDLEVLDALPEDIRNEILQEYTSESYHMQPREQVEPVEETRLHRNVKEDVQNNAGMDVSLSQVDPTFLEALPADVRKELEADFIARKERKTLQENECVQNKDKYIKCSDPDKKSCSRSKSVLSSVMTPSEIRNMIRIWVSKESEPLPCDVHILKHYFDDLISDRNINDLHVIIKSFYRFVSQSPSAAWAKGYQEIISSVQTNMLRVYHSRLQVQEKIVVPN